MSGKSKIEWLQGGKVWNPVTGCTKVSEGCRNCYAERMSKRLAGRCGYPEDGFKVTPHPDKLDEPLRWKKPSRIFVCSMGDLFHERVTFDFVDRMMDTIFRCPQHTFLLLTKRPDRMKKYFEHLTRSDEEMGEPSWKDLPNPNIWLGVSVEDQATADERIPVLLQTPAAKRFVSYEPARGAVDFCRYLPKPLPEDCIEARECLDPEGCFECVTLDWIIQGGESGSGARPMHPDWARSVRDQCKAAGVPFFFKQWGEWAPLSIGTKKRGATLRRIEHDDGSIWERVGKRAAGCLLDGKEHKETLNCRSLSAAAWR